MIDRRLTYEALTERVQQWGQRREDVRALILIGSRARTERPADEWSDMDLLLLVEDPASYVATADWLSEFGSLWLSFTEPTPDGRLTECRALYEGALDVDFVPFPVSWLRETLQAGPLPPDFQAFLRPGFRFLLDKEAFAPRFALDVLEQAAQLLPGEADFQHVVYDFLHHCVWTAKKLRRGELWRALDALDCHMKWHCLLPMLEWHALAVAQPQPEVWPNGRFVELWADPAALDSLATVFARYDEADAWRALQAMMTLFRRLALEVAGQSGYHYPADADSEITIWLWAAQPGDGGEES